jgi:sorbitol/mannitol transport system substrate-binding protein
MAETTITVATVNNGDMIRMQGLMDDFNAKHPDIKVEWVTLEENVLRQNVTTDIATGGGQYRRDDHRHLRSSDLGQAGLAGQPERPARRYDVDDLLPAIRGGLTVDGNLMAAPFYGESLDGHVPQGSDGSRRADHARRADLGRHQGRRGRDDRQGRGVYGICLRGKAGWGENMAFLTAMSNSFGARWFDENWVPQFDQPEWKATLRLLSDLMNNYGPPGASNNGFNENLTLFQQGKCGMWIDATVAASAS